MVRRPSFGGLVINTQGQLLIRQSGRVSDGEMWTFPKGHPRNSESPEDCALREVLEETGVVATIVRRLPGSYEGSTTVNVYFVMRAEHDTGSFDDETVAVQWVSIARATQLISRSPYEPGRSRDLAVLETFRQLR